jgi:hypothetical protein
MLKPHKHHKKQEDKQKKTKLILAIIISLLMVLSVVTIVLDGGSFGAETTDYKGNTVSQSNLGYEIKTKEGQKIVFTNFPGIADSINTSFDKFYGAVITFNPNEDVNYMKFYETARFAIWRNLNLLNIPIGFAITENTTTNESAYATLPIMDCNYENLTIVYLTISNTTSVIQKNNCIIVSGRDGGDLLLAKDALVYKYIFG